MTARLEGVMFDFSGTLMRVEPTEDWLRVTLREAGISVESVQLQRLSERLEYFGALPGGVSPQHLPGHVAESWASRDLDPTRHRAAYTALMREAQLPWGEEILDSLYARHMTPAAWKPYPDTKAVLKALKRKGIRIAVISNIGWDLRPVLKAHDLDSFVDVFVLSYEHGRQKPDRELFQIACDGLGLAPDRVAMVGDDEQADGGATVLGCPVHFVEHRPADTRPDGLGPVLDLFGRAGAG
jgi:HAD superfamily hydrolase (TIGR01493 family)